MLGTFFDGQSRPIHYAAGDRAVVGVEAVGSLRLLAGPVVIHPLQRVGDVDAFDNQDFAVLLDLADRL